MKNERLGEENCNNFGTLMKIIVYNNVGDIWVEFQDEYKTKVHAEYGDFKKGKIKNPYDKNTYNIGYLGKGKYCVTINGKVTKVYKVWRDMLKRCYDPYFLNEHPTYRDCIVCEEWHNFQNFASWWEDNLYECNNEKMCLDKDILIKGNKIYSPKTCMFVPEKINTLIIKCDSSRGEYPIGVSYDKQKNKLMVRCNIFKTNKEKFYKFLGYFPINKPFQAFTCYKNFKENYIKQIADEYKELIPQKVYDALYKYEIEIND